MKRGRINGVMFAGIAVLALVALGTVLSPLVAAQEEAQAPEQAKQRLWIRFCVDQWNLPLSDNDPLTPGADVEFTALIAKKLGLKSSYYWTNTGGGVRGAMAESILMDKCDCFVGLPTRKHLAEEMAERGLVMTVPYYGTGFVLAVPKDDTSTKSLEDLKEKKIGVVMGTVADWYLFKNGYNRFLYQRPEHILQAMTDGEVDAGLVWAPLLGWQMLQEPDKYDAKTLEGCVPIPDLRVDVGMAVKAGDPGLKEALDRLIGELASGGELQKIFEKYGIPYFAPFRDAE